ncbi:hypothetical protein EVG20_g11181 [Dentipellis fragilis]|uniref:Uncharacterized protein n=1 Tax=Dentipellis fragilis TaxID=205917 RepID=A0A4Y9XLX4_9AGAM|nr:hypothetical protein EVG20_g11181 [Dentipellis fragilis]
MPHAHDRLLCPVARPPSLAHATAHHGRHLLRARPPADIFRVHANLPISFTCTLATGAFPLARTGCLPASLARVRPSSHGHFTTWTQYACTHVHVGGDAV